MNQRGNSMSIPKFTIRINESQKNQISYRGLHSEQAAESVLNSSFSDSYQENIVIRGLSLNLDNYSLEYEAIFCNRFSTNH